MNASSYPKSNFSPLFCKLLRDLSKEIFFGSNSSMGRSSIARTVGKLTRNSSASSSVLSTISSIGRFSMAILVGKLACNFLLFSYVSSMEISSTANLAGYLACGFLGSSYDTTRIACDSGHR